VDEARNEPGYDDQCQRTQQEHRPINPVVVRQPHHEAAKSRYNRDHAGAEPAVRERSVVGHLTSVCGNSTCVTDRR
jgi:hypothetical protein